MHIIALLHMAFFAVNVAVATPLIHACCINNPNQQPPISSLTKSLFRCPTLTSGLCYGGHPEALNPPLLSNAPSLPKDVFQRIATKAIRGDFGKIPSYKMDLYTRGLSQKAKCNTPVWLTCYFGTEAGGKKDARGNSCTRLTAACNKVPQGTWLWSPRFGFRKVLDTGSRNNDYLARHPLKDSHGHHQWRPAKFWADIWYPEPCVYKGWTDGQTHNLAVIAAIPAKKRGNQ